MNKGYAGLLLPGWMSRDDLVSALQTKCIFDPPLSVPDAERVWRSYQDRVAALPERAHQAIQELALSQEESPMAEAFMHGVRQSDAKNVTGVVKVNPGALLIHQLHVVTAHSLSKYAQTTDCVTEWGKMCLGVGEALTPVQQYEQRGSTQIAHLAHGGYRCDFKHNGEFAIVEPHSMISVVRLSCGAMWLSSGYHRAYAALVNSKPVLAAVVTHPDPKRHDCLSARRPPTISDYQDATLAMPVQFWRLRYELHIDRETRTSRHIVHRILD